MAEINITGIKGHQRQIRYISNLVKDGFYPQALLFSGPSGTGKKLIAERFIGSIFCSKNPAPCFDCDHCRQVRAGTFPDFFPLLKDDKGKIPAGDRDKPLPGSVRWLIEKMSRTSVSGRMCALIDGVDTISEVGQNALLKTIEEPPAGATILLIAESSSLILPTIVSRCLEITFNPLAENDIFSIIESQFPGSADNRIVSVLSGGSMETALYLRGEGVLHGIFELCGEIASFINGNNNYLLFPNSINEPGNEIFLTVMINIFSYMFKESSFSDEKLLPEMLYINDPERVREIVKILLAARKGLGNNLNVKNSLKGMLYSFNSTGSDIICNSDSAVFIK